jgi:hypothetical protein
MTTYSCIFDFKSYPEGSNTRKLMAYLAETFVKGCPIATQSYGSVSSHKKLAVSDTQFKHRFVELAAMSDFRGREKFQHEHLQKYLLKNDPNVLAVEVPVWDDESKLRGHIDIIELIPAEDKIILHDFKPTPSDALKAPTQLYLYKKLFCLRTKIDPQHVKAMYFDDKQSFIINA